MTQLQELSMYQNDLGEGGARALAPALQAMTQLQTLFVNNHDEQALFTPLLAEGVKVTQLKL